MDQRIDVRTDAGILDCHLFTPDSTESGLTSAGPNAWPLQHMKALLETLKQLDETVKRAGFAESLVMPDSTANKKRKA